MSYDNSLRGALFVNDRKTTPNHPDYRGSIEDDQGRQFWVSAWIKEPRGGGDKFLSLSLTPKEEYGGQQAGGSGRKNSAASDADNFLASNQATINKHKEANTPAQPPAQNFDSFDDDIPF